ARHISHLTLARRCFRQSDPVKICSTTVGRGLLEWFFRLEDRAYYPSSSRMDNEKYNPLPRDWREQLAGTREYLEEGKSLFVLIGSKRLQLLRDAFFWFQELSDQISTLRSAIRMSRSNSRPGYGPNSQQYLSYLL